MLPFPMKWLCLHKTVNETCIVLIDAKASNDEPADFLSGKYAVIVTTPSSAHDGGFAITQTPIFADYDKAQEAFERIRTAL